MGVMFALAGSLMARSLKRPALGRDPRPAPPAAAAAVGVRRGRAAADVRGRLEARQGRTGAAGGFVELVCYIVPVGAPPYPWSIGSQAGLLEDTWAVQAAGPLWYLRAYLWFVLASPLLLWAFRRLPWATLLAPLGLTAVVGTGLVTIPGETATRSPTSRSSAPAGSWASPTTRAC